MCWSQVCWPVNTLSGAWTLFIQCWVWRRNWTKAAGLSGFHASQLPDQDGACSTLTTDEWEVRCLTPPRSGKNVSDSELYLFIFSLIDCDFSKQVQCLLGEVCDLLLFKLLLPCFSGAFVVTNVTHKEKNKTDLWQTRAVFYVNS